MASLTLDVLSVCMSHHARSLHVGASSSILASKTSLRFTTINPSCLRAAQVSCAE